MISPKLRLNTQFQYRVLYLISFLWFYSEVNAQMPYLGFDLGDLRVRPGISFEKKCTDLTSFELGTNLITTHGRLKNDAIHYYGIEILYNKIHLLNQTFNGITLNGLYQYVKNPIGFNIQNSVLIEKGAQFLRPEIGVNVFGVISLNYGYHFRLDQRQLYDCSLNYFSIKLSLNLSYGEYLNIVGKSEKKW